MRAPSSRGTHAGQLVGAGESYGIDMVDFTFPVDPVHCDLTPDRWDSVRPTKIQGIDSEVYNLNGLVRHGIPFKLALYTAPRWQAQVTMLNPSRLVDFGGTSLCHPAHLATVVGIFVMSLQDVLAPLLPDDLDRTGLTPELVAAGCKVNRLDVARDFATEGTDRWRMHVATLHSPHWKVHTHGVRNGVPGTVYSGNKHEFVKLYDKSAQSRGKAATGTLRFEAQARGSWLKKAGITDIASATPEAVEALLLDKWNSSGWGNPISDGHTYAAIAKLPHSAVTKMALLGHLLAAADGQPNGLSATTNTKYNRLAVTAGISVGDKVRATGGVTRRLDIYSGREIVIPDMAPPV
jgi:hypothetical protein